MGILVKLVSLLFIRELGCLFELQHELPARKANQTARSAAHITAVFDSDCHLSES